MSDIHHNPEPVEQSDIWSLADTLPLDQVIAVARERATRGEVAALAFLSKFAQQEDERQSFRLQAAEGGDIVSMLELAGQALATGSDAQALVWFEHAAAQGSAEAQVRLGIMIAKGQGTLPDPISAITRICAARQVLEMDMYIEFVLDDQDYPFDLADRDVYYPHVIERIFADYSRQDIQGVYDYLHQLGIQPESDDEAYESASTIEALPAQEYAPKWLTQFLRGLASQSETMARQARLLTAVLDGVHLLGAQEAGTVEVAWFDALLHPDTFMTQLKQCYPVAPEQLQVLYEGSASDLKETSDAVWPSLRHAYHRIQQQQREREKSVPAPAAMKTQAAVTPAREDVTAHSPPSMTIPIQTEVNRFAPYKFNVTPVRCRNRTCAWTGSMTETDHRRCPVCHSYPLIRIEGAKLLNGSIYAKQRDSLLRKHLRALRTVSWYLYGTRDGYHPLASGWGDAAYKLD